MEQTRNKAQLDKLQNKFMAAAFKGLIWVCLACFIFHSSYSNNFRSAFKGAKPFIRYIVDCYVNILTVMQID